ncbi:MAG: VTT domain-containing protein [Panacagrimonas sp.]
MLEHAQDLLAWIAAHPGASQVLLFAVAMVDALLVVGVFVPAGIVLFGMGALVALGSLELWPTALIAAAGALTGDTISFLMGRHYGQRLFASRWALRYPEFVASGRAYLARHGGKSVVFARFLGPVRAIVPALAGASHMPLGLFLLIDAAAALSWALVYLVPGVLFGASLGLAAEVATRLAVLLVLSLGLLMLGMSAVRAAIVLFSTRAEQWVRHLLEWSRRHRRLGRFGPGLADPDQAETPALIAVGGLLLMSSVLWLLTFGGAGWRLYPGALDALIHQTLSDLSTPWGTATAQLVSRLGEWPVYATTAAAVLAALLSRQRLRAAAHWLAALIFGAGVVALLSFFTLLPAPVAFFSHLPPGHAPLRDLVLPTIVYGYAATLFATQRPARVRQIAYGIAITLVLLIAMARLVLAQEWFSLTVFALILGLLWVAALALGYRQHGPERLFAGSFALPVVAAFLAAAGLSWGLDRAVTTSGHTPEIATAPDIPVDQWWDGGWLALPPSRIDVRGRSLRPFDLQWAAPVELVEAELERAGWQVLPPLQLTGTLRWLTETTSVGELPVLPQVHAGNHARLTLRYPLNGERDRLIRLWDSGLRVSDGGQSMPVWLGSVVEQQARTFYRLFRYPVADQDDPTPPPLPGRTELTTIRAVEREGHRVWLMGPPRVLYTAPLHDAPAGRPAALPPTPH